jgi:uncharacterized membrane protein YuzA (DUF378 family)
MKALRRNPADLLVVAMLSVGALSLGLVSLVGFDWISELSGPLMVWSRSASAAAGLIIWQRWTAQKSLQREYVRVRA